MHKIFQTLYYYLITIINITYLNFFSQTFKSSETSSKGRSLFD